MNSLIYSRLPSSYAEVIRLLVTTFRNEQLGEPPYLSDEEPCKESIGLHKKHKMVCSSTMASTQTDSFSQSQLREDE